MSDQPQKHLRTVRSFVKRTGRMSHAQKQALTEHWPRYGIDFAHETLSFDNLYPKQQPIVLEIGFGMGTSLVQMAEENPHINYLGIEVHTPGIGNLLDLAHQKALTNLKVIEHDAVEVLKQGIDDHSLTGVQIFFPDPWHKKKHHKRRLIQKDFVALLVQKLKVDGFIHVATDWEHYAEQVLEVLSECEGLKNQHEGYAPRPETRPLTKFEKRGHRLNHGVWDIIFTAK